MFIRAGSACSGFLWGCPWPGSVLPGEVQRGEGRWTPCRHKMPNCSPCTVLRKLPWKANAAAWAAGKGTTLCVLSEVFMCNVKCRNPRALPCLWGQVCTDTLSRLLDNCPAAPYRDEAPWQPTLTLTGVGLVTPSSSSFPRHIFLASLLCWLWHSCAWAGSQVWIWKMISFLLISVSWTASAQGQRSAGVPGSGWWGRKAAPAARWGLPLWHGGHAWDMPLLLIPEMWAAGCWESCGAAAQLQCGPSYLGNSHDSLLGTAGWHLG